MNLFCRLGVHPHVQMLSAVELPERDREPPALSYAVCTVCGAVVGPGTELPEEAAEQIRQQRREETHVRARYR